MKSKTLNALKNLGLNLENGQSPHIFMDDLEVVSGLLQHSNGAKIIRDDSAPFSFFKIERFYSGRDIKSVKFVGYRDVEWELKCKKAELKKKKEKVASLNRIINEIQDDIVHLESCNKSNTIYSRSDLF